MVTRWPGIRAGMDEFAVLVFRDQPFTDDEQLAFARRLDGELHRKTGSSALYKSRFGDEALTDVSNVAADGEILKSDDRRRMYGLGNRLWHTDASFQDPPGRYSMLSARIDPVRPGGHRVRRHARRLRRAARRDAGPDRGASRPPLHRVLAPDAGVRVLAARGGELKGAVHPLVRTIPRSQRRSLYLASHASRIVDWPVPEGRLLLRDLIEHATQPQFVYRHVWRVATW